MIKLEIVFRISGYMDRQRGYLQDRWRYEDNKYRVRS
jgi:hypothetical protein